MNKFKKEKILSKVSKRPATRKTIRTIAEAFNEIDNDEDYVFRYKLEAILGGIIHYIYQRKYDIRIIPKEITIKNWHRTKTNKELFISRELIMMTKKIINKSIINIGRGYEKYPFSFIDVYGRNRKKFNSPGYICFVKNIYSGERFLKDYEEIEKKSSTPEELIWNLSYHYLTNGHRLISMKNFIKGAYLKLGIKQKEFKDIVRKINNSTRINHYKSDLKEYTDKFNNDLPKINGMTYEQLGLKFRANNKSQTKSNVKREIVMCAIRLHELGEIDDWEPLFDYKVKKNRNKAYARYLENKDKDGWCKLQGGIRINDYENVFVDMLVYTKQAEVEIRNKCKWVKITLN